MKTLENLKDPASDGIDFQRNHDEQLRSMGNLVDEFKKFVFDAINEGMHHEYENNHEFLKDCLVTFSDIKQDLDY